MISLNIPTIFLYILWVLKPWGHVWSSMLFDQHVVLTSPKICTYNQEMETRYRDVFFPGHKVSVCHGWHSFNSPGESPCAFGCMMGCTKTLLARNFCKFSQILSKSLTSHLSKRLKAMALSLPWTWWYRLLVVTGLSSPHRQGTGHFRTMAAPQGAWLPGLPFNSLLRRRNYFPHLTRRLILLKKTFQGWMVRVPVNEVSK
jgi:hypothetical protein